MKKLIVLSLAIIFTFEIKAQDNCGTGSSASFNTITTDHANTITGSQYPNTGATYFDWTGGAAITGNAATNYNFNVYYPSCFLLATVKCLLQYHLWH